MLRPVKRLFAFALTLLAGCVPHPPAHWAVGGADVDIPAARWARPDASVDIQPDGKILVDGEHYATLDRAGRVYDADGQPIALLEPDGRVTGPDDASLGFVGRASASLPGATTAWIALQPTGDVLRFDPEGAPSPMGRWMGQCGATARTLQVCTLVTHLLLVKQQSGPRIGIGFGFGVGVRVR